MREFDDNSHSYGPVLRRIGILVAVILMVPVMLWTITSFMRTYVAQPVIASPKPLFAPATTASIDTANAGTPATRSSDSAPTQTASISATGKTANDSNAQSPAAKVASLATSDMPPSITPGTAPQPAANSPSANSPSANSPWPDPNPAIGGQAASAQTAATDTQAATATNNDDVLPPSAPLKGPIPLPPRRPAVIAMATPGVGAGPVPLPRARPSDAGTPAESASDSGGNFLTHLFGQTH
jgi:hypothetical protein